MHARTLLSSDAQLRRPEDVETLDESTGKWAVSADRAQVAFVYPAPPGAAAADAYGDAEVGSSSSTAAEAAAAACAEGGEGGAAAASAFGCPVPRPPEARTPLAFLENSEERTRRVRWRGREFVVAGARAAEPLLVLLQLTAYCHAVGAAGCWLGRAGCCWCLFLRRSQLVIMLQHQLSSGSLFHSCFERSPAAKSTLVLGGRSLGEILLDTSVVPSPVLSRRAAPTRGGGGAFPRDSWSFWEEPISPDEDRAAPVARGRLVVTDDTPTEQTLVTKDFTDYLLYETNFTVPEASSQQFASQQPSKWALGLTATDWAAAAAEEEPAPLLDLLPESSSGVWRSSSSAGGSSTSESERQQPQAVSSSAEAAATTAAPEEEEQDSSQQQKPRQAAPRPGFVASAAAAFRRASGAARAAIGGGGARRRVLSSSSLPETAVSTRGHLLPAASSPPSSAAAAPSSPIAASSLSSSSSGDAPAVTFVPAPASSLTLTVEGSSALGLVAFIDGKAVGAADDRSHGPDECVSLFVLPSQAAASGQQRSRSQVDRA